MTDQKNGVRCPECGELVERIRRDFQMTVSARCTVCGCEFQDPYGKRTIMKHSTGQTARAQPRLPLWGVQRIDDLESQLKKEREIRIRREERLAELEPAFAAEVDAYHKAQRSVGHVQETLDKERKAHGATREELDRKRRHAVSLKLALTSEQAAHKETQERLKRYLRDEVDAHISTKRALKAELERQ